MLQPHRPAFFPCANELLCPDATLHTNSTHILASTGVGHTPSPLPFHKNAPPQMHCVSERREVVVSDHGERDKDGVVCTPMARSGGRAENSQLENHCSPTKDLARAPDMPRQTTALYKRECTKSWAVPCTAVQRTPSSSVADVPAPSRTVAACSDTTPRAEPGGLLMPH